VVIVLLLTELDAPYRDSGLVLCDKADLQEISSNFRYQQIWDICISQ